MMESSSRVINSLRDHLRESLKGVTVYKGFPEGNKTLKYPCIAISLIGTKTNYTQAEIFTKKKEDGIYSIVYNVGSCETIIQVDLFEEYRGKREQLYARFRQVLSSEFKKFERSMGLHLKLTDYYDSLARIEETDSEFIDNSDLEEYRAKIRLLVDHSLFEEVKRPEIKDIEIKTDLESI